MRISTLISVVCAGFFIAGEGVEQMRAQAPFDCLIQFDDAFALGNYYDQARAQFGSVTQYNQSTNKLEYCKSGDWRQCWAYRQRCSYTTFYVNFWPWNYNHAHLPFDNEQLRPELNPPPACFCDPHDGLGAGYGFNVNGVCNTKSCPKWAHETRPYATVGHAADAWTYMYVDESGDHKQHVFELEDITVGDQGPIQIWYVKTDGTTWGWDSLDPGYHWLGATDATSVWIGNAVGNVAGPAEIVDFMVWPQY
jgi:hypothetical protein